ncbi:MAG TPA: DUF3300 domain-containing protein [Opitutaceae bacterium]
MTALSALGLLSAGALSAFGQDYNYNQPAPPPPPAAGQSQPPPQPPPPPGAQAPQQQFASLPPTEQLVSSIALYPDPLIGLVLPASTEPWQVQRAAQYLNVGWQPDQLSTQPWAQSVKDLAHYPSVLQWMATNIQWTQQLGAAFSAQPDQVMGAIQNLRQRALSAGTLQSNPQVQVVQDNGSIRIVPTQAQVLYVPQYNPYSIYFAGDPDGYISWSMGYPCGPWLGYYPDWYGHAIWTGNWYDYSLHHGGWRAGFAFNSFGIGVHIGGGGWAPHPWHVAPNAEGLRYHFDNRGGYGLAHPHIFPGAPGRDRYYADHRNDRDGNRDHFQGDSHR